MKNLFKGVVGYKDVIIDQGIIFVWFENYLNYNLGLWLDLLDLLVVDVDMYD